jgi:hypothetical protein
MTRYWGGDGQDHEDMSGRDLLRRVRFQLRYPGQWKFSPPRATKSGQWEARREALVLTGVLLADLIDECEEWEAMAADDNGPQSVPEVPPAVPAGRCELDRRTSSPYRPPRPF